MTSKLIINPKSPLPGFIAASMCDYISQTGIFNTNKNYAKFEVTIYDNINKISETSNIVTLKVNQPPINGKCKVTPKIGQALTDRFNFSCDNQWEDMDGNNVNLYHKYFINNGIIFKTSNFYPFYVTMLSQGYQTITAIIMDNNYGYTCKHLQVTVQSAVRNNATVTDFVGIIRDYVNDSNPQNSAIDIKNVTLTQAINLGNEIIHFITDRNDSLTGLLFFFLRCFFAFLLFFFL